MTYKIAVVIPSYKVTSHVLCVIDAIDDKVSKIYVVDDACPDSSGDFVEANCRDERVVVLRNEENQGVGGAVIHGYRQAIADEMDIIVKIDGDGQMDPDLIPFLAGPIESGLADYTKGNRFFSSLSVRTMPKVRLFGNAILSFLTKASSGYWQMMDPTNGYTAIHSKVAHSLELDKISKRYFFESDILHHLGKIRARVVDVPIISMYGSEKSNLKISKILGEFLGKNIKNTFSRIVSTYFFRSFSAVSIALLFGLLLLAVGGTLSIWIAISSNVSGTPASTGRIFSAGLMLLFGFQLLLTFVSADIASDPSTAIHRLIPTQPVRPLEQRPVLDRN